MIDPNNALRALLLADTGVSGLVGDRIYAPTIPQDFNPSQGLGLAISTRGGTAEDECPILTLSMQFVAWAPTDEGINARAVYRAVFDALHGKNNIDLGQLGYVLSAMEEVAGQDGADPETNGQRSLRSIAW